MSKDSNQFGNFNLPDDMQLDTDRVGLTAPTEQPPQQPEPPQPSETKPPTQNTPPSPTAPAQTAPPTPAAPVADGNPALPPEPVTSQPTELEASQAAPEPSTLSAPPSSEESVSMAAQSSSQSAADFTPNDDAPSADKPKPPMRIGEKLIQLGIISGDQLQVALQEQRSTKKLLGATLVDLGFITEHALGEILAESAGTVKFDPKTTMLDPELVKKVPKEIALRYKVLAVAMESDRLTIITPDVYNVLAVDQVKRYFDRNLQLEPLYCSEAEILELIDQYYDYELSIDGILKEIETGERDLDNNDEGYVNPTVRLVDALLVDSIKMGASDIHFEPEGQFVRLRYRIDGDLVQVRSFHLSYWPAITVRIKIMSDMNIAETRMPQDGRISFQVMGREVDFRVATQPTVHGENIVMRLLDKTKSLVPLENLGFADHNINLLKKLLKRPEGIFIVTGPTGSGKTTTLYSILSYINSIDVNIMTLEDPVEYQLPLIRQTNIREGTLDFGTGIKSLMRQDPDIIFLGEVRDEETALMAVRAALTGHQVFTTLHTNDAMGAVPRLGDIGVPAHLLAGSLICTLAQRLARKLCENCKQSRLADPEETRILGFSVDDPPTIYDPVGCKKCNNTGHKGRIAIIEILRVDEGLNNLIANKASRKVMMNYALDNGFIPMPEDGIDKVLQGTIDLDQLIGTLDMTDRM